MATEEMQKPVTGESKKEIITPQKMPTKEEVEQMQQRSFVNQLQNIYDQATGRAQGIERDAVRSIIMNAVQTIMRVQNENERLRNENNQLKTELANIQGSKIPKKPVVVKTKK